MRIFLLYVLPALTLLTLTSLVIFWWHGAGPVKTLVTGPMDGTIVGVMDGDTVKLLTLEHKEEKVRFYGIDAPEKGQGFTSAAKRLTSDLVFGRDVRVEVIDTDKYGRRVGIVSIDPEETSVNEQIVAAGFAWRFPKYCKREPLCQNLERLEKEAREARRGLWADPAPTPPWQWRQEKRQHIGRSADPEMP